MVRTGISAEEAVPFLKLLGDRTRLSIVLMLHQRQCCVCEMVDALDMSQPRSVSICENCEMQKS
ncbi:ArsR/SmtB family transcription factor [Lentibacillus sp.]|uniref:ArsR/SmtB family transcription factor n=1 Tax=Lentibacillus sp. TaxID=1925746 RepID=UPI0039C9E991